MIMYENEIKRMNVWEKVVQTSNEVGFAATSVEKAKVKLSKAMASFGLVLYQASEGTYRLVNIHDTNECVEIAGQTRDNVLLDLFNISIVEEEIKTDAFEPKQEQEQANSFVPKFSQTVNTPQEAVAKANEVAKANMVYVNDLHRQLDKEIGTALRFARLDSKVSKSRLGPIFNKIKVLNWSKADFKKAINAMLGVKDFEQEMSNDQCTVIIDHLAVKEKEFLESQSNNVVGVNKFHLNENVRRELDGFDDAYIENEIV